MEIDGAKLLAFVLDRTGSDMQPWIGNQAAAVALGISVRQLQRLRRQGVLIGGIHWIRVGCGPRAQLRFDAAACWQALRVRALSSN